MAASAQFKKALDQIEQAEEKIENHETKILQEEERILKEVKDNPAQVFSIDPGITKREIHLFRLALVKKLSRHKLTFALLVGFAIVLVWRGAWGVVDEVPVLNIALVSLALGILILWILKKYTDLH